MKMLRIVSISAPIAACATYWLDAHTRSAPVTPLTLQAAERKMKLEQVQVIFRHGARAPIWSKERLKEFSNVEPVVWDKNTVGKEFPLDLNYTIKLRDGRDPPGPMYDDEVPTAMEGGCMMGQLTYLGQKESYDLGKLLYERYIVNEGLISSSYPDNGIYVRTSYYERAVQSALYLLAGLYAKGNVNEPIRIETREQEREDFVGNLFGCTNFIAWFEYMFSPAARTPEENEFENYINNLMGKADGKLNATFLQINDLIRCRGSHGLNVPDFLLENEAVISQYELKSMQKLLGEGSTSRIRNGIGSFLDTVYRRIDEHVEGAGSQKLILYSAHDWTIISLFLCLGVDLDLWPPVASHLILEVYKDDNGQHFVKILYNDEPVILDDSGDEFIAAEKFLKKIKVYRVVDFDADCGNV